MVYLWESIEKARKIAQVEDLKLKKAMEWAGVISSSDRAREVGL